MSAALATAAPKPLPDPPQDRQSSGVAASGVPATGVTASSVTASSVAASGVTATSVTAASSLAASGVAASGVAATSMAAPGVTATVAATSVPATGRFGSLCALLRKLVDHGKALAAIIRQPVPVPDLAAYRVPFGAALTIPLILASIVRGLHRAAALEQRVLAIAAREQRQPPAASGAVAAPVNRQARTASAQPSRQVEAFKARLAGMTELERIVALDNRRPIGVVLGEISQDLGILPAHPLWRDLSLEVIVNCGNLVPLLKGVWARLFSWPHDTTRPPAMWPGRDPSENARWYQALERIATGPPVQDASALIA